jgi:SAM-dependent methyltransferase
VNTLIEHFAEFAKEVTSEFLDRPTSETLVVEIGCNDGVLLKSFGAVDIHAVGVDPATNVVESIDDDSVTVVNDYFTEQVAESIREKYGQADAIVSSYTMAHIDDMVDVFKGIKTLLRDDGVLIFEVYYIGIVFDETQYDMIYHEHLSYYSLMSLVKFCERFDMEIFDVKKMPLRSGTTRYYVRNLGRRSENVSPAVEELLDYERERGLDELSTYIEFAAMVERSRTDLMALLEGYKAEGKTVAGYGASGRATTIMSYCGITTDHLDYVVDDAPAKHGFYTPGNHLEIMPWDHAIAEQTPDYLVLFAWSFFNEVVKRRGDYLVAGGKFIVPLPEVSVFSG